MNFRKKFLIVFPTLAAILAAYTFYDNNQIAVREQIVYIKNLPQEFDGFRILQLSDLHGKSFGTGQSDLISKVNSIEYDMLALTGDMESSANDFSALIELLRGINNKELVFYVNGNDDIAYSSLTGDVFDSGRELEENGCILLTKPYPVTRSGKTIWISNDFTKSKASFYPKNRNTSLANQAEYSAYKDYQAYLRGVFSELKDNGEVKIAVTHIPLTKKDFENLAPENILDYSLIIAGHYHGGQIRIPFYGALLTPGTHDEGGILFPDQKDVCGLAEHKGIQQYISAGLGASVIPFRLFDTPEINLIILKSKQ